MPRGAMVLAAVAWPTSSLLVSEVQTGGASASDEFVELANAGPATVDLAGLEVVYVTSSGSTVTRKATWTASRPLDPGRHLLLANASGVFATMADGTYTGGLAATGGSLVLRPIGGVPLDAVGWGDASNGFVEGSPVAAPAAGSSVERSPGGAEGNGADSNDNATDLFIQAVPWPQNLAAAPTPDPDSTPTPTASPRPTSTPTPTPTPTANPTPIATPTETPTPTATPTESPADTPAPTSAPSPSPSPSAVPTPSPTASPSPPPTTLSIADARRRPLGATVTVAGVITADAGRLGLPHVAAIQDATAGIVIRLPEAYSTSHRGAQIQATGLLAAPYGQLELRSLTSLVVLGDAPIPAALDIDLGELGEDVEGRLVAVSGTVASAIGKSTTGDLAFALEADGVTIHIVADASSRLTRTSIVRNASYRLTGVAGQRATGKGRLDGYRIWLRDVDDVERLDTGGSPEPSPRPSPSPTAPGSTPRTSPRPTAAPASMSIARALLTHGIAVTIEGRVTAPATLLDATGRRLVIEDSTAAIEVLLPAGTPGAAVGARLAVDGTVVRAYGAPRLRATAIRRLAAGSPPAPASLSTAPGAAHEWRLVRVSGVVADVHRLGDRWRAEVTVGRVRIPIAGLPGAHIPSTALIAGHRASVVGIVRRAYPGATDRRFAIVPRNPADIDLGAAETAPDGGRQLPGSSTSASVPSGGAEGAPVDADIADLAARVGQIVRVGGLIVAVESDGARLDDGTGVGRVILTGPAADYVTLLEQGDAVNATGVVERRSDELVVVVSDPAGLARVADLGPGASVDPSGPQATHSPLPDPRIASTTGPFGSLGAPGAAGLASLVLISAVSATVTLLRRRRVRNRVLAAVAARVPTIGRQAPSAGVPETPDPASP